MLKFNDFINNFKWSIMNFEWFEYVKYYLNYLYEYKRIISSNPIHTYPQ